MQRDFVVTIDITVPRPRFISRTVRKCWPWVRDWRSAKCGYVTLDVVDSKTTSLQCNVLQWIGREMKLILIRNTNPKLILSKKYLVNIKVIKLKLNLQVSV